MATNVSMSSFDAKLKNWYIDRKKLYLMDGYKAKFFSAITKKTDAAGKQWNVAVGAGSIVGLAGTYANSWSNATAGTDVNFYGVYKDRFGHGFIDDKVIRASRNAEGAIEPALETKISQVRDQFIQGTEYQLFRSEAGGVGEVSAFTLASGLATFTANTAAPATQLLRPGHVLKASAAADGSSLRTGTWTVQGVGNGTLTVTGSIGATPISVGDTLYIDGDATKTLCGMADWCPKTEALAATSFKNVNRAADTRALGGIRIDATGLRMTEAFIQAGDEAARFGANSSLILVHPTNYSALKAELQGQAAYVMVKGSPGAVGGTKGMSAKDAARFGFKALALDGSDRPILVAPAWACQLDVSWGVELDSVWLETMGSWPSLKDLDGNGRMIRLTDGTSNAYVHELVGYGEFLCSAPGHQVCIVHSNDD